jgi:hypothetical protein
VAVANSALDFRSSKIRHRVHHVNNPSREINVRGARASGSVDYRDMKEVEGAASVASGCRRMLLNFSTT